MKLTSKDCKKYIVEWYSQNRNALPFWSFALPLEPDGTAGYLGNGLNPNDWKRQAIAKIDNKVYRLFQAGSTVIDAVSYILIIEDNGKIESLTVGTIDDFEKYFGFVG